MEVASAVRVGLEPEPCQLCCPGQGLWTRGEVGLWASSHRGFSCRETPITIQLSALFLLPLISSPSTSLCPLAVKVASLASKCFLLIAQQAHCSCWGPLNAL